MASRRRDSRRLARNRLTGRLGYIHKPIYAAPAMESPRPGLATAAQARQVIVSTHRRLLGKRVLPAGDAPRPTELPDVPPPPSPAVARPARPDAKPGWRPALNLPQPNPPQVGQEL